ncbi:uncharacterized protein [Dermacentor andersoni]|uniref:uncharacterized protein n=1 Tax=Dermacentor andersoni TaxID=34620 RepID=UPI003B3B26FB
MNIGSALTLLFLVGICESSNLLPYDMRCDIVQSKTSTNCTTRGWYFDASTRQCFPSCMTAPFSSQLECQGVCRSGEACHFQVESDLCLLNVFPVYVFDMISRNCFMTYDCSFFGNKFPTSQECEHTCGRRDLQTTKGMVVPILHAGQQNPIGQATAQSQMNLGGGNIVPQLPSGIGLLPGSSITTGTQVQSPQGSVNALVGHQTTATQSMTTTGAGIAGISITNGQQQSTGHAVSSITAVEPSANLSQHEGVGQATPPQTMLGSGTAGEQTAHDYLATSILYLQHYEGNTFVDVA